MGLTSPPTSLRGKDKPLEGWRHTFPGSHTHLNLGPLLNLHLGEGTEMWRKPALTGQMQCGVGWGGRCARTFILCKNSGGLALENQHSPGH